MKNFKHFSVPNGLFYNFLIRTRIEHGFTMSKRRILQINIGNGTKH